MTVQNKKRSMVALMVILTILVGGGCLGTRYGDKTWVALVWLVIVVLSIFKVTFAKNKDYLSKSNFVVAGFFTSLAFVLAIPMLSSTMEPYRVLLYYLPLHFYLIYYVITKERRREEKTEMVLGIIADSEIDDNPMVLSDDIRQKCRQYIGEDEVEKAIDLLINHLAPIEANYNDILQVKQKWNRVERDKNLNVISPDDADRQFSRIVQTLLDILDD